MNSKILIFLAIAVAAILIFMLANSLRSDKKRRHHHKRQSTESSGPTQEQRDAAALASKPAVIQATEANFHDLIEKWPGKSIVLIYAPWCGYCTKLKPKLHDIANRLDKTKYQVLEINADEAKRIASEYPSPFPTVLKFHGTSKPSGKLVGDRSTAELLTFIES